MSIDGDLESIVLTRARLAARAADLDVVWPNSEAYDPATGPREYLVVQLSPGRPTRAHVSDGHSSRAGFLVLGLMTELHAGMGRVRSLLDLLTPLLSTGEIGISSAGVRVEIVADPQQAAGYEDRGRWRTPIVIEYRAL